jgi:2-aminoadipate transaminase
MKTPWEYRYAQRTQRMGSSAIRELLKYTELPDLISFAGGLPFVRWWITSSRCLPGG